MQENGTTEQEKGYHGQPLFFLGLIRRRADWKKQNDGNWPKFNELEKIHLEKWVKETRGRPVITTAEETPAEKPKKIALRPIQKEAPPAKPKSSRPPALQGNAIAGPSKMNKVVYVRRTAPEVPSEGENDMGVDGPKSFQELDQGRGEERRERGKREDDNDKEEDKLDKDGNDNELEDKDKTNPKGKGKANGKGKGKKVSRKWRAIEPAVEYNEPCTNCAETNNPCLKAERGIRVQRSREEAEKKRKADATAKPAARKRSRKVKSKAEVEEAAAESNIVEITKPTGDTPKRFTRAAAKSKPKPTEENQKGDANERLNSIEANILSLLRSVRGATGKVGGSSFEGQLTWLETAIDHISFLVGLICEEVGIEWEEQAGRGKDGDQTEEGDSEGETQQEGSQQDNKDDEMDGNKSATALKDAGPAATQVLTTEALEGDQSNAQPELGAPTVKVTPATPHSSQDIGSAATITGATPSDNASARQASNAESISAMTPASGMLVVEALQDLCISTMIAQGSTPVPRQVLKSPQWLNFGQCSSNLSSCSTRPYRHFHYLTRPQPDPAATPTGTTGSELPKSSTPPIPLNTPAITNLPPPVVPDNQRGRSLSVDTLGDDCPRTRSRSHGVTPALEAGRSPSPMAVDVHKGGPSGLKRKCEPPREPVHQQYAVVPRLRDGVSHCESLRANAVALDLLEQRYNDLAALNDTEDPLLGGSETESNNDMSPKVYVTNPSESQFIDEILEENKEVDDEDKWEFPTLQPLHCGGPGAEDSNAPSTEPFTLTKTSSQIPRQNDLRHNIVQIVHHNGIYHLALLTCACRGLENVCLDLMYRRLVVTSFVNHCTLFTADVLDYFCLVNLELKAFAPVALVKEEKMRRRGTYK
ncbi:hypothetical protein CPB83DRAFT_837784 [Crepidotus variabilis]|uniref:CxC2-like cysteine cluster KDZ transposase-associated domain-containing protein n=1 Tax=Crepidotus variabilis TaxID=179855 RepID=A0A9P6JMM7_9AGAR|nr:hypothetical protein CPB83DRAFT_837784 [Crepidotus variabilis]